MLDKIRALFEQAPTEEEPDEAALHLAAAVLLVEVARADHSLDDQELDRLRDVLRREWSLSEDDLADLVAVARDRSRNSVSLHGHIDQINRNYSPQQKFALVRGLWQVACADERIHHHEEALIRRLADLIYVPHSEFIRAKHVALGDR